MDGIAIEKTEIFLLVNSTHSLLNCTEEISENCLITSEDDNLESALFAVLFCVIFILLLALLLLLICKVWSLRRSVVPSIYKIDQTTGAVVSAPNMTGSFVFIDYKVVFHLQNFELRKFISKLRVDTKIVRRLDDPRCEAARRASIVCLKRE